MNRRVVIAETRNINPYLRITRLRQVVTPHLAR
jgi:hypothetical protein